MGKSEEDQLICGASPVTQREKNLPAVWKMRARSLGQEDPRRREWLPTSVFLLANSKDILGVILYYNSANCSHWGNCSRVYRIPLYYFLYPYVNLQLTQKKKFNLKIFTSSIFTDNILLNVVLKRAHSYQHIFLMNENIQVKNSYKSTFLCPQPPPILHSQSTGPTSR